MRIKGFRFYVFVIFCLLLNVNAEGADRFFIFLDPPVKSFIKPRPEVGINISVSKDSILSVHGVTVIEESIGSSISPRILTDEQFKKKLKEISKAAVKCVSANSFFPGQLKLVGPLRNENAILSYADSVMRRCKSAGIKTIVLGSGEARRIPAGYDSIKATNEFIDIVKKIAVLAKKYDRIIALENLNHTETNFILSVNTALAIVKAVNHPNFKLTADIYHMQMENESPSILEEAGDLIADVHIAEKEGRGFPGKQELNFRPFIRSLKKAGYIGNIMIECKWNDFDNEFPKSVAFLRQQIDEIYDLY
ncbi:MAG: sugar phosphate isomerase/epimerase family protein [Chitinophagaceae bacterium]